MIELTIKGSRMFLLMSRDEKTVLRKDGKYMAWGSRAEAEAFLATLNGKFGKLLVTERNVVDEERSER